MSRLYLNFVQRSFKYLIFLFFIQNAYAFKNIDLNDYLKEIEVVSKFEDRKKGLMYRKSIPDDYGMFFVWSYEKKQCMWMKDTFIALNVAYLNNKGEILEIYDMVPLSKKSVCSKNNAKYALEVNKGWFERNNFKIGDFIDINKIISNDN